MHSRTSTAELYDPTTNTWNTWAQTGSPRTPRGVRSPLLPLANGTVLALSNLTIGVTVAEVYTPSTGVWSEIDSPAAITVITGATVLADGTVLVAGRSSSPRRLL